MSFIYSRTKKQVFSFWVFQRFSANQKPQTKQTIIQIEYSQTHFILSFSRGPWICRSSGLKMTGFAFFRCGSGMAKWWDYPGSGPVGPLGGQCKSWGYVLPRVPGGHCPQSWQGAKGTTRFQERWRPKWNETRKHLKTWSLWWSQQFYFYIVLWLVLSLTTITLSDTEQFYFQYHFVFSGSRAPNYWSQFLQHLCPTTPKHTQPKYTTFWLPKVFAYGAA